jgi:hypothetical protein
VAYGPRYCTKGAIWQDLSRSFLDAIGAVGDLSYTV